MKKILVGLCLSLPLFLIGIFSFAPATPVSPSAQAPDQTQLVALGRKLFYDKTLSQPSGLACVSCHDPAAGFSYPESATNQLYGTVPGIVSNRYGNRKPPSMAYAAYLPTGIPRFDPGLTAFTGGLFFDGRAADTTAQAEQPFLNPNEMNSVLHSTGDPALVVQKVRDGASGDLFRFVYGPNIFGESVSQVYVLIAKAIAAFEASPEVAPFSSKYDAWLQGKATLTPDELTGLRLVTGRLSGHVTGLPFRYNAHCMECHGITDDPASGPNLWTFSCYANIGVPRNPNNPYYKMTDKTSNPIGYNPQGGKYVDFGLGDFLYPKMGLPAGDLAQNDPLAIDGAFKTPTLRNVDKRPFPGFVKSYMHNGVFKSLKQVVHFYNTRNLTTVPGEVIDFTQPHPYANLKGTPLWPPPEWPSAVSMINPQGASNVKETVGSMANEQIGNMGMTDEMENQIVDFLKTLTDGYFDP